eukprot:gene4829-5461_t
MAHAIDEQPSISTTVLIDDQIRLRKATINDLRNRLASPGNITKSQSAVNDVIRNSADRAPQRSQSVTATHHHNSKRD